MTERMRKQETETGDLWGFHTKNLRGLGLHKPPVSCSHESLMTCSHRSLGENEKTGKRENGNGVRPSLSFSPTFSLFHFLTFILLACCWLAFSAAVGAEPLTITGKVTDESSQEGIPAALVELEVRAGDIGDSIKTQTDHDGDYVFENVRTKGKKLVLVVTAAGYLSDEIDLKTTSPSGDGRVTFDFSLEAEPTKLNEIVNVFRCCIFNWSALTTMLPAFLLAGAIAAFIPSGLLVRYLGSEAKKTTAYSVAAGSGIAVSLCSCNIVPLFLSIYRRGAGVGPAFAFLYAGPAINFVSMIFVFQVIGPAIGFWRIVTVPIMAIAVGVLMAIIFRKEEKERQSKAEAAALRYASEETKPARQLAMFFALMLAILVIGALTLPASWAGSLTEKAGISHELLQNVAEKTGIGSENKSELAFSLGVDKGKLDHLAEKFKVEIKDLNFIAPVQAFVKVVCMGVLVILLVVTLKKWFDKEDVMGWFKESWRLIRMIVPILVVCLLVIAYISVRFDLDWIYFAVGNRNDFMADLGASVFGSLMYFPILTEVGFVKAFLKLGAVGEGMGIGPAMSLLLLGPGLSLPGMILVARGIGFKKVLVYAAILVVLATIAGVFFGSSIGQYICSCKSI